MNPRPIGGFLPEDPIAHERYWRELAKLTGLTYYPDYTEPGLWEHRIVGYVGPYLTLVRFIMASDSLRPLVGVLVRFALGLDTTASRKAILSEPDLNAYSDKAQQRKGFGLTIDHNYAWFTFPYEQKKEPVESVAEKVMTLVRVISKYGQPTNQCEGQSCPTKGSEKPQLVLIDNLPMLLCDKCLTQLPAQHLQEQAAYYAAPAKLLRGTLFGIGVAVLGAIVWAIIAVLFQLATAGVGLITFMSIVLVMDRSKTKVTTASLLVAGGLAVASSVLGAYLAALGAVLRESPTVLSSATLSQILAQLQQIVSMNRLLRISIGVCLLGVVPYAGLMWWQRKRHLESAFHHRVEAIDLTRVFRSLYE